MEPKEITATIDVGYRYKVIFMEFLFLKLFRDKHCKNDTLREKK